MLERASQSVRFHPRVVSSPFQGGRPEDVRRNNRALALELLREQARSRTELARAMQLSKPALGDLVSDLIQSGLVLERAPTPTFRGRHPAPLEINRDRFHVIGVDVAVSGLELGLFDAVGQPLEIQRTELPVGTGREAVYATVLNEVSQFNARSKRQTRIPLAAVGVTAPGPIDARSGTVLGPPNFSDLGGLDLAVRLERDLNIPVRLERDATAAATAYLNRTRLERFVYILLTSGIGASIVINREVHRGEHGFAGEFGHVSVDRDGARCACGNCGCVEGLAGSKAIETEYAATHKTLVSKTVLEIAALARGGDALATHSFEAAGKALGVAAVSLVNLLDPAALVLGGPGAAWADLLLPAMREQLEERAYPFLDWGARLPVLIAPVELHVSAGAAECVLKAIQRSKIPVPALPTAVRTEVVMT